MTAMVEARQVEVVGPASGVEVAVVAGFIKGRASRARVRRATPLLAEAVAVGAVQVGGPVPAAVAVPRLPVAGPDVPGRPRLLGAPLPRRPPAAKVLPATLPPFGRQRLRPIVGRQRTAYGPVALLAGVAQLPVPPRLDAPLPKGAVWGPLVLRELPLEAVPETVPLPSPAQVIPNRPLPPGPLPGEAVQLSAPVRLPQAHRTPPRQANDGLDLAKVVKSRPIAAAAILVTATAVAPT